ncbi:MAG: hypothetical protein MUP55_04505 [Candidatus Aenigmarchaeota archaeon]|nr:hypothetical protein [Candidatus Aenigmarchaeota archaeon]
MLLQIYNIEEGFAAGDGRTLYIPCIKNFGEAVEAIYSHFSQFNPEEREIYNHVSKKLQQL